jgi:hypothetical protein
MSQASEAFENKNPPQALPIVDVVFGIVGPVVWAAHFLAVYFGQSTACSMSASTGTVIVVVGGLTAAAIAGLLSAIAWLRPDRLEVRLRRYLPIARYAIALSIVAVVWSTFAMVSLEACQPAGG